jgi:extracellular factor (EF) 3-hydroxypalmitic acid methyl ester biosynthesis protein
MLTEPSKAVVGTSDSPAAADQATSSSRAHMQLEQLEAVAEEFFAIDRRAPVSVPELLHATAAGMHRIAAALSACEAAGISRKTLLPVVEPLRSLHARSPLVRRLQTWPRGYPGDFETVEWLCDAENRAPMGTLEWAIEQCALQSPIAQQHRNKVGIQARAMLKVALANPHARIASIGCGGCRDLSLVQELIPSGHGHFVLIDADPAALKFARDRLSRFASRCEFVTGTVPRVLSKLGGEPFDLVVAGGLFDYLPDRWAVATLRGVRRILAPFGRVLLSNIVADNAFRTWLEYLGEWRLIARDPEDLEQLLTVAGFSLDRRRIFRDSSGLAIIADAGLDDDSLPRAGYFVSGDASQAGM